MRKLVVKMLSSESLKLPKPRLGTRVSLMIIFLDGLEEKDPPASCVWAYRTTVVRFFLSGTRLSMRLICSSYRSACFASIRADSVEASV